MRLDFNVLWVEDNQGNVQSQREAIAVKMRKEGFKLNTKFASSVDAATTFLAADAYGDHIDLVLMDYDLGPGQRGDEGLKEVRKHFPHKDIVFYSGYSPGDLLELAGKQGIGGVFISHRNELPDQVIGVFENLVKKVLDIDHSRGIVMGATSNIDQMVDSLLHLVFEDCCDDSRKECLKTISERLEKKRENFEKSAVAIKAIESPAGLSSHYHVYTSDDRLRLLIKMLKQKEHEKVEELHEYRTLVVPKRNDLAHAQVTRGEGFKLELYDRDGGLLTSEHMRELRLRLLQCQEVFEGLHEEFQRR